MGMAAVECNLKSFLVKLRKTHAVRGHGTAGRPGTGTKWTTSIGDNDERAN